MPRPRISAKAERFTESVIREMNRLAVAAGAVSLAQGFPDFACPPELKRAAAAAVDDDINQYAITWGSKPLRDAIARSTTAHFPAWGAIDPETQVTVTCGATEAMIAAMLGLLDPGDEIVVFEPYYENYGPDAILTGAVPRYVTLHEPDWSIDPDELRAAFGPRTRGIVVNSPHNPTGKVFRRDELELIAGLCVEFDAIAFTDDIYEHIVFEGEHIPLATLPGHGRPDGVDPLDVQVVLGHRLADRLGDRLARAVGRDPARARFPDRRRGGPAAGRGGRRPGLPRRVLRRAGGRLSGTARPAAARAAGGRLPRPRARREPIT